MRLTHKVEYLLYPPDYIPFGKTRYRKYKTLQKATNIGIQLGKGSIIHRQLTTYHKKGGYTWQTTHVWNIVK